MEMSAATNILDVRPMDVVGQRWLVMEKLGAGGFGAVFMVADRYGPPGQIAAMKVERRAPESPPLLQMEVDLMERLAGKQHVLPVLGKGRNKQFNWLVMGYAGPDLSKLRRRLSSRTFSPCTTLMIGLQIFNALQGLHDLGFVHRDVKPENLAVDRDLRRLCLLDFGMARRFINDAGRHHRARPRVAFRGTARYASPWALQDEEQSRRDDLYSTVYVMVEMIKGKLPWDDHQSEISRPDLGRFKQGLGTDALCQECEPEIKIIAKMIDRLRYADDPDYHQIKLILATGIRRLGGTGATLYDWEPPRRPAIHWE